LAILFFGIISLENWKAEQGTQDAQEGKYPLKKNHPRLQDPRADLDLERLNEYALLESKGYGTRRLVTPPSYAKPLSEIPWMGFPTVNWLIVGLDYRVRYEFRENDFRRPDPGIDQPFLLRTRGFFAIQEILDPLRFTLEVEDAQKIQSRYPSDDREENRAEPIQGYLELYKKKVGFLDNKPISLRAGRMAFELLDRRLVALNEWRNTTNNFQGARLLIGDDSRNWNLDFFSLQPIRREILKPDIAEEKMFFSGGVGTYKFLDLAFVIQAYSFLFQQSELKEAWDQAKDPLDPTILRVGRRFQTTGLRVFGQIGKSGFDYDLTRTAQRGLSDMNQGIHIDAHAFTFDLGYSWNWSHWKPRIGGLYGIASGNTVDDPNVQRRFDRLYGFARPWSMHDYITYENIRTGKFVFEFSPTKDTRIDTGFTRFWLASPFDRWERAVLQDTKGISGTHIGDEFNIRWITKISPRFLLNIGYAYFLPGEFTISQTGRNQVSNFYYIEFSSILI
jgi:hypothetical protein